MKMLEIQGNTQLMATITRVKKRYKQIYLYGMNGTYCGNITSHQTKYIQGPFKKKAGKFKLLHWELPDGAILGR